MNILEICDTIEAVRKVKDILEEAFKDNKEEDDYIGTLALLAKECGEYCKLYEEKAAEIPEPEGVEW